MKPIKIFHELIFELTEEQYDNLLQKHDNLGCNECEKQLFIVFMPNYYIAINNQTGEFFREEFASLNNAYIWLLGLAEANIIHLAESTVWWQN